MEIKSLKTSSAVLPQWRWVISPFSLCLAAEAFKPFISSALVFLFLTAFGSLADAQKKSVPQGRIKNEGTIVYKEANFDAPVMTYLSAGKVYPMSTRLFGGAFYRILVSKGKMGYVADTDIEPLWKKKTVKGADGKKQEVTAPKETKSNKKKLPMEMSQFAGLNLTYLNYTEDTMGNTQSEWRPFYGVKLSGPDLVIDGLAVTDVNILFSPGAPKYYEEKTGNGGNGFTFITNFLFQSVFPQGQDFMTFFGFGPMLRYSKYNLKLGTTTVTQYAAEDAAIGAVFNLGLVFRMGNVALRLEGLYNWEKEKYFGGGLSLQMGF